MGTSKKLTCCDDDSTKYNTNGATHTADDGDGVAGGAASIENIAKQRMCPPPDGDDGGYAQSRYGDTISYLTTIDHEPYDYTSDFHMVDGVKRHCFHNRSLLLLCGFVSLLASCAQNT